MFCSRFWTEVNLIQSMSNLWHNRANQAFGGYKPEDVFNLTPDWSNVTFIHPNASTEHNVNEPKPVQKIETTAWVDTYEQKWVTNIQPGITQLWEIHEHTV